MGQRERGAPREPGICQLKRVPIEECGEELVNIRTFCTGIVVKANPSLLRITAARMLQQANDSLPAGYSLRVHTALRTYEMQTNGYTKHLESLREKHPEWPFSVLRREANKFWHPPDERKAPPGHVTGGAVDVNLLGPDGEVVDVTSTVKEGIDSNPTYVRGLTPEALRSRRILIAAMQQAGFSNCADEWWHWSYGDNGWAVRVGQPTACYGPATPSDEEVAAATVREEEPPADPLPAEQMAAEAAIDEAAMEQAVMEQAAIGREAAAAAREDSD